MANDDRTLTESFIGASPFLIKVLELVVALLCLVLIYVPFDNRLQTNLNHVGIVYVTYCCAVIVNGVLIGSHLQGERVPQKTLFIFSTVLGILFFITGCVVLNDWWTLMHNLYFHHTLHLFQLFIFSTVLGILFFITGCVVLNDWWTLMHSLYFHHTLHLFQLFIFSTILGILFFITGCVVLNDWWTLMHSLYFHPPKTFLDMMICSGVFSILNSLIFFTDIWLTYRYG